MWEITNFNKNNKNISNNSGTVQHGYQNSEYVIIVGAKDEALRFEKFVNGLVTRITCAIITTIIKIHL